MPLLAIKELTISFAQGTKPVVDGVSLAIDTGELLAVVGESGSGKSVTALSVMRLLDNVVSYPSGSIHFNDKDVFALSEKQMQRVRGNDIAMIFQEPMTSLNPLHTIEKQISEVLILHKHLKGNALKKRCLELLAMVGLKDFSDRLHAYPHQLSGGQRQRVMIAMALACEPKLLIADEPTTALDVTVQKEILILLKRLQKETGMAVLFITHDLAVARKMADRLCVMQHGKVVETGYTEALFSSVTHDYTKHLLSCTPSGAPAPVENEAPQVLEANNIVVQFPLTKNFFGKPLSFVHAVKDACLSLKQGETLGIVGESGSGKSTLALAILKLLHSQGSIEFDGTAIAQFTKKQMRPLRKDMQIVFQDPFASLNPRMTVAQIIAEGLNAHHIGENAEARDAMVCHSLQEVGLDAAMRSRYPHEFSGGQRQRVAIARALVLDPKLIIFDEPTSALDVSVQSQIIQLLRSIQKERAISYLFISHDLRVVRALSHRVMVMKHGDVVEANECEAIFSAPQQEYTKTLINASNLT